jgi:hypothetical protein
MKEEGGNTNSEIENHVIKFDEEEDEDKNKNVPGGKNFVILNDKNLNQKDLNKDLEMKEFKKIENDIKKEVGDKKEDGSVDDKKNLNEDLEKKKENDKENLIKK